MYNDGDSGIRNTPSLVSGKDVSISIAGSFGNQTYITTGQNFSISKERGFHENTNLNSEETTHYPIQLNISGEFTILQNNDKFYDEIFEEGNRVILKYGVGVMEEELEVYIESVGINSVAGELVEQVIKFRT